MRFRDGVGIRHVGNGQGQLDDLVIAARAQAEPVERVAEQVPGVARECAMSIDLRTAERTIQLTLSAYLPRPDRHHPFAHRGARLAGAALRIEKTMSFARHFDMEIDPLGERP